MLTRLLIAAALLLGILIACLPDKRRILFFLVASMIVPMSLRLHSFAVLPHSGKAPLQITLSFVDVIFIICAFFVITSKNHHLSNEYVFRGKRFFLLILGYILFSVFSLIWAMNRGAVIAEVFNQIKLFLIFYFIVTRHKFFLDNIRFISMGLLLNILIQLTFSVIQVITGEVINLHSLFGIVSVDEEFFGGYTRYGLFRAFGTVGPGELAIFVSIAILWAFTNLSIKKFRVDEYINLVILAAAFAVLLMTQSRNSLGAIAICIGIGFAMIPLVKRKIKFFSLIALAGSFLILYFGQFSRFTGFWTDLNRAYILREGFTKMTVDLIWNNTFVVFLGAGQNNFIDFFQKTSGFSWMEWSYYNPVHNMYVLEWAETGIVGVLILMSCIICFWRSISRVYRKICQDSFKRQLYTFCVLISVYLAIVSFFSWGVLKYSVRIYIVFFLGICSGGLLNVKKNNII